MSSDLIGLATESETYKNCRLYADLYSSAICRGRAMALFMAATSFGPVCGPIISGYLSPYRWNWPFWFALIFAGLSCVMIAFLPETFGPTILKRRALKIRKENPSIDIHTLTELEMTTTFIEDMKVTLARPFRMFFREAIVLFSCLYLALVYAVFYIFLQAYPLIFPRKSSHSFEHAALYGNAINQC